MAKRSSLSFAESAISDLEEVIAWFTEQGIPETGRKLVEKVIVQTERLTLYPDSGRVVPEFAMKDLREIIYPPFRIVYRREKGKILVVRIWRSERLLKLP
jgi:plasmid stabilization system protein ParE